MKIVFLERKSLGDDLNLDYFNELGEIVVYQTTSKVQVEERISDADIVIANKAPLIEETLKNAQKLRLICLTATGTNNVDFSYTNKKKIVVTNVKGYSTNSVVQHTFALLFYVFEKMHYYDIYVKNDYYANSGLFSHFDNHFNELYGKRWGIIGLGDIGKGVAKVATAFGCEVVYYSTSGMHDDKIYKRVGLSELLTTSDIISIHSPLNNVTMNLIGKNELQLMKKTAYLINVGRGSIVNEEALTEALKNNEIAGAALDVLSVEPIEKDNPLNDIKDSDKLVITPHLAWGTVEARNRLMKEVYYNIKAFYNNEERNVVR